jgi:hypothetical protein
MPLRLRQFLRRGVQPNDDPREVATLAIELAGFWQMKWATELLRRVRAESELTKLKINRPRGRPRDIALFIAAAQSEPKKRGAPPFWIPDMDRKLLTIAAQGRRRLESEGQIKVTDLQALTSELTSRYAKDGISASTARRDAKAWLPRLSEAKARFGKSAKK